jgi:hypothetical protein
MRRNRNTTTGSLYGRLITHHVYFLHKADSMTQFPGERLANIQIYKTRATIVRHYNIIQVNREKD